MKDTIRRWVDYLYVAEVMAIFSTLVVSLIAYASQKGF